MADVFEEVEEQLRSARYQTIFRKGWPIALGALLIALVVALGIWGFQAQRNAQSGQASETYNRGLEALSRGDKAAAEKEFGDVARSGPAAYKTLALMQQAGLRMADKKTSEAVALLDQAAKAAPTPLLGDAAQLKAALALLDTAPLADIEKRLTPLTADKRPYRPLAREALAIARLNAGKIDQAKAELSALDLTLDAPEDVRVRAQAVGALIQAGTASSVAGVAKAAAALPPAPPGPPPGAIPQLQSAPPQAGPEGASSQPGAPS
ncbi:MAG: tetratricopeptide repeat protein [Caulobacteraceae bacterium]